jgi:hypothetical protein
MKPSMSTEGAAVSSPQPDQGEVLDYPDFRIIPVTLTFDGYPPLKFKFRRQQSQEVKDARQAYYALPDDEQKEKLHSYRVNILSQILEAPPTGVPNFPVDGDSKANFIAYFNDPDNEEILQWIWSIYQEKLYPKELLSSALE